MTEICYSKLSLSDLDDIENYIANNLHNPSAARRTINGIMDTIDTLSIFPEMGANVFHLTETECDYRFVVYGSYIVFYHIDSMKIYVDRILYGKSEYMKILFDNNF